MVTCINKVEYESYGIGVLVPYSKSKSSANWGNNFVNDNFLSLKERIKCVVVLVISENLDEY